MRNGLDTLVAAAAVASVAFSPAVQAADKTSAVLNAPPSHVAAVKKTAAAVETPVASAVVAMDVAVSTLQGLGLSKKKMEQFQALSPENQSAAMFFYNGLKTGNAEFQKEGMTKIIRLLAFHEENQKALISLKKTPNATVGLSVVNDTIAELSDPKTYGAILVSPQSPYSVRFVKIRDEATKVFAEAKPLQEASIKMESPELVAARQRLEEKKKVNAALDQVLVTAKR